MLRALLRVGIDLTGLLRDLLGLPLSVAVVEFEGSLDKIGRR